MKCIRKKEDLEKISPDDKIEKISLKMRLTKNTIVQLLNKFKNLKEIYVPNSILKNVNNKLINALKKVGVKIIETKKQGRKKKIDWKKVVKLYKDGFTPSEISKKLKINRRSVYYILKKKKIIKSKCQKQDMKKE